jgi:hypothetical protein
LDEVAQTWHSAIAAATEARETLNKLAVTIELVGD